LKVRGILSEKDNLVTSREIFQLSREILILLIQPYPFLQGKLIFGFNESPLGVKVPIYSDIEMKEYYYHANDLFALLTIVRLYTIIRFLLNNTTYRSPRARRVT